MAIVADDSPRTNGAPGAPPRDDAGQAARCIDRAISTVRRMAHWELESACEAYAIAIDKEAEQHRFLAATYNDSRNDDTLRDAESILRTRGAGWETVAEMATRAARDHLVNVVLKAATLFLPLGKEMDGLGGRPLGIQTKRWIAYLRPRMMDDGEVLSGREDLEVVVIRREDLETLDDED